MVTWSPLAYPGVIYFKVISLAALIVPPPSFPCATYTNEFPGSEDQDSAPWGQLLLCPTLRSRKETASKHQVFPSSSKRQPKHFLSLLCVVHFTCVNSFTPQDNPLGWASKGGSVYRNNYKGHVDNNKGGGNRGRSWRGLGWGGGAGGERQKAVLEQQFLKIFKLKILKNKRTCLSLPPHSCNLGRDLHMYKF